MTDGSDWADIALEESRVGLRLIRAAIHEPAVMRDLLAFGATRDDFLAPSMRRLWDGVCAEYARAQRIDMTFLRARLMDDEGSDAMIALVLEAPPLDDGIDLLRTMQTLRRRVALRRLMRLGERAKANAGDPAADPSVLAQEMIGDARKISDAASTGPTGIHARRLAEDFERRRLSKREAWVAVPSGLPLIDTALGGGLPAGAPTLLMASTGSGKSTYARHVVITAARHMASKRSGALIYYPFEAHPHEVTAELVQQIAGVRIGRTWDLGDAAESTVVAGAAELGDLPIYVEPRARKSTDELFASLMTYIHRRAHGAGPLMVVLDNVQALRLPQRMSFPDGHVANSLALADFFAEHGIVGLLLSQVSPKARDRAARDPKYHLAIEDPAGGAQYGQDAYAVIVVERKRDAQEELSRNVSRARLLKNRALGNVRVDQWMRYDQRTTQITPCDADGKTQGEGGGDAFTGDDANA